MTCKKLKTLAPNTYFKKDGRLYYVITQSPTETRVRVLAIMPYGITTADPETKVEVVDLKSESCP